MRPSTVLLLAATALALATAAVVTGWHWLGPPKPAAPSAPVQYQYTTLHWPEGTQTAFYNFRPGDCITNDGKVACRCGSLGVILVRARQATGFDFFAAVADTVILRRVAPGPSDPAAGRTNLWIAPLPHRLWEDSTEGIMYMDSQNFTN